jgi:WD40 repeat protein/serine/threonine protein kinase
VHFGGSPALLTENFWPNIANFIALTDRELMPDASGPSREKEIFERALDIDSAEERERFLAETCGDDAALLTRVQALLKASAEGSRFLPDEPAQAPTLPDTPVTEKAGDRIGHYKLLQQIGEGGCGIVYMAEQEEPVRRRVALKVLKLGMDTKSVIARFEAERQALALMDHPNIAKVLDAGATDTGRPYFVMELVRGVKITDFCDEAKLPTRARLNLFVQVCQAIQHAHQKGVIHRDIKPSNILVTVNDGVPVPKVIDFGIAKATAGRLTDKTLFTAFEQFMGTPAYMSPEQAVMTSVDIDTRSDIYSLGVLLYELLTGKTPFDAQELLKAGLDELRRTIREHEPPRPSTRVTMLRAEELTTTAKRRGLDGHKLIYQLRGDLDWIVMKCVEKDRSRRYDTANGLGRDIERHLNNEPVMARPPSTAYRVQKFVRRNKVMVTAVAAIAIVLVLGIAISAWEAVRATHAKGDVLKAQRNEIQQLQRAENTARVLRENLYAADMGLAFQAWELDRAQRARELLEQWQPDGLADLRGFEWRYLHGLTGSSERFTFTSSVPQSVSSALSPDDRFLALTGFAGHIDVWDFERKQFMKTLHSPPGIIYSVAFSADNQTLASTLASSIDDANGSIYLWDLHTFTLKQTLRGHTNMTTGIAFSPDGKLLASVAGYPYNPTDIGKIFLWDLASGAKRSELTGHDSSVGFGGVTFSPSGRLLATAHGDGSIRIWDLRTEQIVQKLQGHRGLVFAAKFSPDAMQLANGGIDGTVRLWQLGDHPTGEIVGRHTGPVYSVAFSPNGKRLVSGSMDTTARLWDLEHREELQRFRGHSDRIWNINFARDGRRVVTGSWDGSARLWEAGDGSNSVSEVFPYPGAGAFVFSPDSRWMIWNSRFWSVNGMTNIATIHGGLWAFSPDGKQFVTQGSEPGFQVWSVDGGKPRHLRTVTTRTNVTAIWPAFSPDGKQVTLICGGTNAVIWSTGSWHEIGSVHEAGMTITAQAFSSDGKWLTTAYNDGRLRLWHAGDLSQGRLLAGHRLEVKNLAFSSDRRWLATASMDRTVRLWEMATGESYELRGDSGWLASVAFSPDSRTLAAGTLNGEVKLWNVTTRREMVTLRAHLTIVTALGFSPDGRLLASSGGETLRLWNAPTFDGADAKK